MSGHSKPVSGPNPSARDPPGHPQTGSRLAGPHSGQDGVHPVFMTQDPESDKDEEESLAGLSEIPEEETLFKKDVLKNNFVANEGKEVAFEESGDLIPVSVDTEKKESIALIEKAVDGDLSINKLLFMKTRTAKKEAASLVASGPRGCIHFWNVFQGGCLMAQFPGSIHDGAASIHTMVLNSTDTLLATGDNFGFVYLWNIEGYCMNKVEEKPAELLNMWRAHIESVTCMDVIENENLLLTSSMDCTVRLWTLEGEYIGTFGQPDPWDIFDPKTYQHPMVPYDVLVDPLSLPTHKVYEKKLTMQQVVHGAEDGDGSRSPSPPLTLSHRPQIKIDDTTIAAEIKEKRYATANGKRLRHERNKPLKQDRGGPSEYQMLRCHALDDTPHIQAPAVIAESKRSDPLAMFEDSNYAATA